MDTFIQNTNMFRQNTELTIVPGKITMFGYVLDYELTKTFKTYLRKLMREWFEDERTSSPQEAIIVGEKPYSTPFTRETQPRL